MVQADRVSDPPVSGRIPTERGWSLNFLSKGPVAAGMAALVALLALGPTAAFAAGYDPGADANSMYWTTQYMGATDWWGAGYTGAGVDVAVIDTGVSPVEGLATEGKIIYGPDLSLESQAPNLRYLDTNGHGTFMAGLIAGHDSALTQPYASAPASAYRGVAPDARIVSVKVGVADGGVDVSQVIAAIDWVVQHKNDNGLNIRVINLSYGTNSTQLSVLDPLSYAAEQAWKAGIVVVAAAGNTGYQLGAGAPGLADPAYNPWVIAAGGYDTMGTAQTSDDVIGQYSATARCFLNLCRHPSFVAVGSRLQGLRVPGGYVDQNHGQGQLGGRYIRGSGTSEAAAITSGSVALLLQKYPQMPPDQVKKFLVNNATNPGQWPLAVAGAGELNLAGMLSQDPPTSYDQRLIDALGWGSLERSRGTDHLSLNGILLEGDQDIFGKAFNSWGMARLEAAGSSWTGGTWNGSSWTGSSWTGNSWTGSSWTGNSWTGSSWTGNSWTGNSWTGSSWSGSSWTGSSWSGNSWTGSSWSGDNWN